MPDNRKSRDLWLTDAKVEEEIAKLRESEYVALARAEERQRHRRRQYLYQLRNLEKRGRKLAEEGWTPEEEDDAEN
jgi:hypothetical protein